MNYMRFCLRGDKMENEDLDEKFRKLNNKIVKIQEAIVELIDKLWKIEKEEDNNKENLEPSRKLMDAVLYDVEGYDIVYDDETLEEKIKRLEEEYEEIQNDFMLMINALRRYYRKYRKSDLEILKDEIDKTLFPFGI